MDDQLNDDATCGSIDSNTHGISITPRVGGDFCFCVFKEIEFPNFSYQQQ